MKKLKGLLVGVLIGFTSQTPADMESSLQRCMHSLDSKSDYEYAWHGKTLVFTEYRKYAGRPNGSVTLFSSIADGRELKWLENDGVYRIYLDCDNDCIEEHRVSENVNKTSTRSYGVIIKCGSESAVDELLAELSKGFGFK